MPLTAQRKNKRNNGIDTIPRPHNPHPPLPTPRRHSNPSKNPSPLPTPQPPARALHVIEELNSAHEKECGEYAARCVKLQEHLCTYNNICDREKAAEERFQQTRRMVMDIYHTWSLSNGDEDSAVCSKQALEAWMSRHLVKPKDRKPDVLKEGQAIFIRAVLSEKLVCLCRVGQVHNIKSRHCMRTWASRSQESLEHETFEEGW